MLKLHGQSSTRWDAEPFVARIATNERREPQLRRQEVLLLNTDTASRPGGFLAYLTFDNSPPAFAIEEPTPVIRVSRDLGYLTDGDILYVAPRLGHVSVLYRRRSNANILVLSERCNCACIMCPQPPRGQDRAGAVDVWLAAIALMDQDTPEIGISGGEPTMVPDELLSLIRACRDLLSRTALHVLSNGRMLNYLSLCRKLADIAHPDLVFGIPLYSDLAYQHDFIVQADGAFDQTIRGIINLARCGQRVEIRCVLLRQNVDRLSEWARFITRNLPFADHIALMGLEPMGFAAANWKDLWVDPANYQTEMVAAVNELNRHNLNVSIYNHQLCLLDPSLWSLARRSISDWKVEYLQACSGCRVRAECGGLFASARQKHSPSIHPV